MGFYVSFEWSNDNGKHWAFRSDVYIPETSRNNILAYLRVHYGANALFRNIVEK
ncbi:MAG: hypothetical protein IJJ69_03645 [Oscillospiraceae bacterium]|nr:hypothetical protein [Oscillospiraceae bacterium]